MQLPPHVANVSGYKLNLSFKTSTQFKYLGVNVTKTSVGLYKENFSKLLDQITQDGLYNKNDHPSKNLYFYFSVYQYIYTGASQ